VSGQAACFPDPAAAAAGVGWSIGYLVLLLLLLLVVLAASVGQLLERSVAGN
jgi:hypothetical protein